MEKIIFDMWAGVKRNHWMVYAKELFAAPYIELGRSQKILDAGCGAGPETCGRGQEGSRQAGEEAEERFGAEAAPQAGKPKPREARAAIVV